MNTLKVAAIGVIALTVLGIGFVLSGVYNMAADEPHSALVLRLVETLRERSIEVHAKGIAAPKLDDPALIAEGAEHYSAMCTGCHLAPGMYDSEIRPGLYPQPPILAKRRPREPAQDFWIIKHGIKMSGMPAWGATHDDDAIWGMVAFLQKLPELSPDAYQQLVPHGDGSEEHEHEHEHEHTAVTSAGPAMPASTSEPVATVDRFFQSLAAGDAQSASAALDPNVLIFESGGAERSRQEYAAHHLGSDSEFLKSAKYRLVSRTGDSVGDLSWVATEARLSAEAHDKPVDLQTTETMILRKNKDGWRIVHIHWSSHQAKE